MLPFTALAFAALSAVQAKPVPSGWSTTGMIWPDTGEVVNGAPNEANPTK
jgi:hypothetical protein